MQFSKFLILILILCSVSLNTRAQKQPSLLTKKYPPQQLREDAILFRDVMLAMHPAIGIYKGRDFYEGLLENFVDSIKDSLTEKEFRLKLKLVVDEFRCGHTEVLYSREFYRQVRKLKLNYSPYVFIPIQNKVYLLANLNRQKDSSIRSGAEIRKINGITVDSMMRYSRRFISSDGYNQTAKDHYLQLGFNSYYVGLFGRPDTFDVEYSDGKTVRSARYAAFRPKAIPPLPLGPRNDSLFKRFKRASIRYRFLDEKKTTCLVKIDRFSNVREGPAYRQIFRKMKKNGSRNLVLDLRNNGGGSLANSYKLLRYILDTVETQTLKTAIRNYPYRKHTSGNVWFRFTRAAYKIIGEKRTVNDTDHFVYSIKPRKKFHFGGKIIVLINGGSFSASSLVATYLKSTGRATFIGEETGGTAEGCNAGITPYYTLPNTRIRVRTPAFRIVHDVSPQITGRGIMPDHKTEYSLKDIMRKRDLELQKARELLQIP
jgi:hypothetical protein